MGLGHRVAKRYSYTLSSRMGQARDKYFHENITQDVDDTSLKTFTIQQCNEMPVYTGGLRKSPN